MILLIVFLVCILLVAGYIGYRRIIQLDYLTQNSVLNSLLVALGILTIMSLAHWLGLISQTVAANVTMTIFTTAGGFFIGYGIRLVRLHAQAGTIEYMYRSFWTDVAPNLISTALFIFGIYRLGFMRWPYLTGIGITSGLSLIGFGFLGWTIRIVPEFRVRGILMLDQYIEWNKVVSYQWESEETLKVDYLTSSNKISEFKTYIPPEDQLIIERILGKKLKEYEEERRQIILEKDNQETD